MQRRSVLLAVAGSALAGTAANAQQASQGSPWPVRPVRWIVPWGAGGAADVISRMIAQKLTARWGHQVNVDNKPGGNTIVAAVDAARAAPDGHTLFMAFSTTMTSNPFMHSKLPYDPLRDFTPITLVAGLPLILLASNGAPASTLPELIALGKKSPDTITFGTAAGSQIQCEQWMRDWGVKFRLVMYKSGVDTTNALLSNEIHLANDAIPGNLQYIRAGKMKALAVNTAKRMPMLPEVPTLQDLNLKNSAPGVWHGLLAPANLPASLQRRIYSDIQAVLEMPDVQERLQNQLGAEIILGIGPQELVAKVRSEMAVVGPLVKELGLKVE